MTIQTQIKDQMKEAMKAKDAVKLAVVRGLASAFTNELVKLGKMPQDELSDEDALGVIRKAVKQRKDSIEQFTNGGRPELAEPEKAELDILESYLPQMMSEEDVMAFAKVKLAEAGTIDKSKAGMFMGTLMKDLKGKADGDVVKKVVDSLIV